MVDNDKIEMMLRNLREYTGHLKKIAKIDKAAYLIEPMIFGSARYFLMVAIENCIDIGNHIIAAQQLRAPKNYKDIFKVLSEAGIFPEEFSRTMQNLAGLRNLLVHVYWQIDDDMIYESLSKELDDFNKFISYVLAFLNAEI